MHRLMTKSNTEKRHKGTEVRTMHVAKRPKTRKNETSTERERRKFNSSTERAKATVIKIKSQINIRPQKRIQSIIILTLHSYLTQIRKVAFFWITSSRTQDTAGTGDRAPTLKGLENKKSTAGQQQNMVRYRYKLRLQSKHTVRNKMF